MFDQLTRNKNLPGAIVIANTWRALTLLLMILYLSLPAFACATCGCSEICPIAMMETDTDGGRGGHSGPTRTDSIIGNMLLKLAYQRDEQLHSIARKMKIASGATSAVIGTIASATLAQNIVSMSLLNPADGIDSAVPGSIGLGLDGATNTAFDLRAVINHKYRKQYHERQAAICKEVEALLYHLEYSHMTCPEAQKQLVALVGERASHDFVEFWKSSHDQPAVADSIQPKSASVTSESTSASAVNFIKSVTQPITSQ